MGTGDAGIAAAVLFGARQPTQSSGVVFGTNVTPAAVAIPETGRSAASGAASATDDGQDVTDGGADRKLFDPQSGEGQAEDRRCLGEIGK